MESKIDLDNQSFFGKGVEFWLGMIVKFDKQKSQTAGMGWGWRYKVRIIGDYSNSDSIEDQEVHTAVALIPTTGGTGGAGKKATVKLTQGDVVFGAFLSPNNNFPVILGALGRTKESADKAKKAKESNDESKFAPKSGFTGEQTPGLTQDQEYSGQDQIVTPKIDKATEKGNGKSKTSPKEKLSDVKDGTNPDENAVGAVEKPKTPTTDKFTDIVDQKVGDKVEDPEILAELAKENNINDPGAVLNGEKPADPKEYDKLKYDYVKKREAYDQIKSASSSSSAERDLDADFDDAMNASQEELDEAFDMF